MSETHGFGWALDQMIAEFRVSRVGWSKNEPRKFYEMWDGEIQNDRGSRMGALKTEDLLANDWIYFERQGVSREIK